MTKQELEGCVILAKFMGFIIEKDNRKSVGNLSYSDVNVDLQNYIGPYPFCQDYGDYVKNLMFTESWNWLMPVWVELNRKVADWGKSWYVSMGETTWWKITHEMGCGMGDIKLAFENIVEGIKWYNQNKPDEI